jgi:hypothetical protein
VLLLKYPQYTSKIEVCLLLLLFAVTSVSVNAQSQEDTTVTKTEVIVGDPNQDSAENLLDEYAPDETTKDYKEFEKKNPYNLNDSLEKRNIPASEVKKMQEDEDFWYANQELKKEKEKNDEDGGSGRVSWFEASWVKTLLWLIIIGGFAVAIILFLSESNIRLFRKKVTAITGEKQDEETEDIFEINYRERIDKAVREGNYRLAVRLMFLQMLKTMSGKNIIQYKQDRTNFDYLLQLHNTRHYQDFFRLTRSYEYTWYGNFPVNDEAWQLIKNDFEKFNNMISVR